MILYLIVCNNSNLGKNVVLEFEEMNIQSSSKIRKTAGRAEQGQATMSDVEGRVDVIRFVASGSGFFHPCLLPGGD